MLNIFSPKSLQPLKGPDVLPPMTGPCAFCGEPTSSKSIRSNWLCDDCCLDSRHDSDQRPPKPESGLRYRPIALLHGGVAVVDAEDGKDTWAILAECKTETTAARICVALDEYDKNHKPPF